jgi:geranylgeranyl pyrophosphate synthase
MPETTARRIVERVLASDGPARAAAIAMHHADAALSCLAALPGSPAAEALQGVCHYVVRRSH